MDGKIKIGGYLRKRRILDILKISNGWFTIKTENKKSVGDFKVKTVFQIVPRIRYFTPKHTHFVIDFFGKVCADKTKVMRVFESTPSVLTSQTTLETWKPKNQ